MLLLWLPRAAAPPPTAVEEARRGRIVSFLLSALKVSSGRYSAAIADFNSDLLARRGMTWAALAPEEQDWALADRVVDLFEEAGDGMTGYARAAVLVASMAKCNPARSYRTAWKTLDVWRQRVPPRQAPHEDVDAATSSSSSSSLCRTPLSR